MAVDFDFPTAAEVRQGRRDGAAVDDRSTIEEAHRAKIEQALLILNQRHAEDAGDFDAFLEAVSEHFRCPELTSRHVRGYLRTAYDDVRRIVANLRPANGAAAPVRRKSAPTIEGDMTCP